ncbi:MAG: integral membrane protein TerC [Gammaproteobacteria bacterium]|nr:MAG: integral membrane protein TerC [Gammaproteobacteria bacterium]TND07117.1 MAG: integral membrane protein TerC [Gammaproteobacteria bacterium]
MEWITEPQAWIALATLTLLEIVLGIDNLIFISILVGNLPPEQRRKARLIGLGLAMGTRIALLLSLVWIMQLTAPLFTVLSQEISGRDILLIVGGLFLIAKSTLEIHNGLEGSNEAPKTYKSGAFLITIIQIAIIDIVFSLDSVITAIGMAQHVEVMVLAIILAVFVMMVASEPVSDFVDRHPTIKMLALSFLVLIGVALVGEGADMHIPKGYIYFAMAFSVAVEMLNVRVRRVTVPPVRLHGPGRPPAAPE